MQAQVTAPRSFEAARHFWLAALGAGAHPLRGAFLDLGANQGVRGDRRILERERP